MERNVGAVRRLGSYDRWGTNCADGYCIRDSVYYIETEDILSHRFLLNVETLHGEKFVSNNILIES